MRSQLIRTRNLLRIERPNLARDPQRPCRHTSSGSLPGVSRRADGICGEIAADFLDRPANKLEFHAAARAAPPPAHRRTGGPSPLQGQPHSLHRLPARRDRLVLVGRPRLPVLRSLTAPSDHSIGAPPPICAAAIGSTLASVDIAELQVPPSAAGSIFARQTRCPQCARCRRRGQATVRPQRVIERLHFKPSRIR